MNLRIIESGPDFLVVDPTESEHGGVIDAYPTRREAESFLSFIGQCPALEIPLPEISENLAKPALHWEHGEECQLCGGPLYTTTPGLCGQCKEFANL